MLKSRKGFMLVEVIITSTVIITAMITLFTGFNKLFVKYESRTNYHNIDALYATKKMADYLFENDINKFINGNLYNDESIYIIQGGTCKLTNEQLEFCNTLKELYNIQTMIFTSYDKKNLENLQNGLQKEDGNGNIIYQVVKVDNQTMKEYIDYVIGYYNITNSNIGEIKNEYDYFILTETNEQEEYYYASIPIR